ncbi:hypothetical protein [Dyella silvatica]|uniref:hypothetical protein n=1 Tax=Dyella silvatica TaxID=2992128 RepID=UPI00225249FE|nr:hypothetical protein [Dyella silvatica]
MSRKKTKRYPLALVICLLGVACAAWADGKRVIPRSEQVNEGYVSSQLLLKPCLDIHTLSDAPDEATLKSVAEARKALPAAACDDALLREQLFKARFLQYATIGMVNDPWNLDAKMAAQNQAIGQCKDLKCLARELDATIAALSPVYLGTDRTWPRSKGLCDADSVDTPALTALASLDSDSRKGIKNDCGEEAVTAQTCQGPHGKLLFVSCAMEGNQVNAPQWLYRSGNTKPEPLLAVTDGPLGVMESSCNGMPDLLTGARISMGEHEDSFYRYDGRQYQLVYAYTSTFVGTDDNGNDLAIAQGQPSTKVVCR